VLPDVLFAAFAVTGDALSGSLCYTSSAAALVRVL